MEVTRQGAVVARVLGGLLALTLVGSVAGCGDDSSSGAASMEPAASSRTQPAGQVDAQVRSAPRFAKLAGRVTRVVDGDTIHVEVRGQRTVVRLIGIDTPETVHPSKPIQCWGPQASARTKRLLPIGARVRLESDPSQDTRDRFGRFLGYVYLGNRGGAASVNRALVAAGAAKSYVYAGVPFRFVRAFDAAEQRARTRRIGLWGPPCRGDIEQAVPRSASRPAPGPAPAAPTGNCDPNYSGACVPVYPPDVNCGDIRRPVTVVGTDVHGFDRDGDGAGCESYE